MNKKVYVDLSQQDVQDIINAYEKDIEKFNKQKEVLDKIKEYIKEEKEEYEKGKENYKRIGIEDYTRGQLVAYKHIEDLLEEIE